MNLDHLEMVRLVRQVMEPRVKKVTVVNPELDLLVLLVLSVLVGQSEKMDRLVFRDDLVDREQMENQVRVVDLAKKENQASRL